MTHKVSQIVAIPGTGLDLLCDIIIIDFFCCFMQDLSEEAVGVFNRRVWCFKGNLEFRNSECPAKNATDSRRLLIQKSSTLRKNDLDAFGIATVACFVRLVAVCELEYFAFSNTAHA
jgi:hypothetical protein